MNIIQFCQQLSALQHPTCTPAQGTNWGASQDRVTWAVVAGDAGRYCGRRWHAGVTCTTVVNVRQNASVCFRMHFPSTVPPRLHCPSNVRIPPTHRCPRQLYLHASYLPVPLPFSISHHTPQYTSRPPRLRLLTMARCLPPLCAGVT